MLAANDLPLREVGSGDYQLILLEQYSDSLGGCQHRFHHDATCASGGEPVGHGHGDWGAKRRVF